LRLAIPIVKVGIIEKRGLETEATRQTTGYIRVIAKKPGHDRAMPQRHP
jgi:hypothetical protein